MNTLRSRLLIWVCGSSAGVMLAAAVVLYVLAYAYQINQLDRAVREKARLIVSMIEVENDTVQFEFEHMDLRDFQSSKDGWYLQVWLDNDPVYHSGSLSAQEIDPDQFTGPSNKPTWNTLPDQTQTRALFLVYQPHNDPEYTPSDEHPQSDTPQIHTESSLRLSVFIARDAEQMLATQRYLSIGLAVVTAAAIILVAAILSSVVNRSLRPVNNLVERISAIDATDLKANVPSDTLPGELQPVAVQFNALLTRLNEAFERERGFCADVAHELRTPLAGLRMIMEVTTARPRKPQQYTNAIAQCKDILIQTQSLIDSLLQIAKLEARQVALKTETININHLAEQIWREATTNHIPQSESFTDHWQLDPNAIVDADRSLLQIVLRNLIENAIQHVDSGGTVRIETRTTKDRVVLAIDNTGCEIPHKDANKVFDRFWRANQARTDTGAHFGLGLSLAKRAAENLGGSLSASTEQGGLFRVTCSLP